MSVLAGPLRGGVGGLGGPGPAKVLFNEEIDCPLGPGTLKYPGARNNSRWPCVFDPGRDKVAL